MFLDSPSERVWLVIVSNNVTSRSNFVNQSLHMSSSICSSPSERQHFELVQSYRKRNVHSNQFRADWTCWTCPLHGHRSDLRISNSSSEHPCSPSATSDNRNALWRDRRRKKCKEKKARKKRRRRRYEEKWVRSVGNSKSAIWSRLFTIKARITLGHRTELRELLVAERSTDWPFSGCVTLSVSRWGLKGNQGPPPGVGEPEKGVSREREARGKADKTPLRCPLPTFSTPFPPRVSLLLPLLLLLPLRFLTLSVARPGTGTRGTPENFFTTEVRGQLSLLYAIHLDAVPAAGPWSLRLKSSHNDMVSRKDNTARAIL